MLRLIQVGFEVTSGKNMVELIQVGFVVSLKKNGIESIQGGCFGVSKGKYMFELIRVDCGTPWQKMENHPFGWLFGDVLGENGIEPIWVGSWGC